MFIKNFDVLKKYNFGCVFTTYNRPDIVLNTIKSLQNSFIPDDFLLVVIDDSSDEEINFSIKCDHLIFKKEKNYGVANSLAIGWDIVYFLKIPFLLNIDSDVIVTENWLSRIFFVYNKFLELYKKNCIVTGFNGQYHNVLKTNDDFLIKESIGGVNLFFSRTIYPQVRRCLTTHSQNSQSVEQILKDVSLYTKSKPIKSEKLIKIINKKGWDAKTSANGWDWSLVSLCHLLDVPMVCTNPSVIQHVGLKGLHQNRNNFEKSLDFKNESLVPKIIHQTWKTKDLPEHLKIMQESVIKNNTDFKYMFWTDEDIRNFIHKNYPTYCKFFNSCEYVIQQIDFFRLLALYHYGGIYIDIDTLCFQNLSCVTKHPITLIKTKKNPIFYNYDFVLNNAFIAAERKNLFIYDCIKNACNFTQNKIKTIKGIHLEHRKIYYSAGPLMVTDTYKNYKYKNTINLLGDNFYHGYIKDNNKSTTAVIKESIDYFSNNYAMVHVHESSWWLDEHGKNKMPDKNTFLLNCRLFN